MKIELNWKSSVTSCFQRVAKTALLACLACTAISAKAANVDTVSSDELVQQGVNGYWQAMVKCQGSSVRIPIKHERLKQDWCSESDAVPCEPTKMDMAIQVCLNIDVFDSRKSAVAASEPTPAPAAAPVRREAPTAAPPQETEQQSRQRQAQAQLAAAIRTEEAAIAAERRRLEASKRALAQAERDLSLDEQQLQAQLREL